MEMIIIILLGLGSAIFLGYKLRKSFQGETECCGTSQCSGNCKSCALLEQARLDIHQGKEDK